MKALAVIGAFALAATFVLTCMSVRENARIIR